METSIKKVGIIISILAVIILALVGCFCVAKVSNNDSSSNLNSGNLMTTADGEFELSGDCDSIATGWNSAVQLSVDSGKNVKVILNANWIAKSDSVYTTSFGEGVGFSSGQIFVPNNANITLDLNKNIIDRGLSKIDMSAWITNGSVIKVFGNLSVVDSSFNAEQVERIFESHNDKETLVEELDNLECGKIMGGAQLNYGGGIYVADKAELNFYGGMVCHNRATRGGATALIGHSILNIYNGLFLSNAAQIDGGVGYWDGYVLINGGYFINNISTHGGVVYAHGGNCEIIINDAIIAHNSASNSGGGMFLYYGGRITMNRGLIANNASNWGGGVCVSSSGCIFTMNGGEISENNAIYGGGIGIYDSKGLATITLNGGSIHNNTAANQGAGISSHTGRITTFQINGTVQIYDNKQVNGATERVSDVYLIRYQLIEVRGTLSSTSKMAYVGVDLATNYDDVPFTTGYVNYNSLAPAKHFFSNNIENNKVYPIVLSNGEAKLDKSATSVEKPNACKWVVTPQGGVAKEITEPNYEVEYNGKPFTITNSAGQFYVGGTTSAISSSTNAKDAGNYAFYTNANVSNPSFILTIRQKSVDIDWENTNLTYNGSNQMPIAKVKASDLAVGDECDVVVSGGQTMAGSYIATATSLSNENYKFKTTINQYVNYTIAKADLTINIVTKDIEKEYNGKIIDIGKDWYTLSADLLGVDSGKEIDKLFNIDTKAFVPQFNGNESAVEVGEYTISTKPFTVSEVFKDNFNYNVNINYVNTGKLTITNPSVIRPTDNSGYDFMMLQNNKRVSYKEKELIHGDNDSEYTNFVLGNIAPNTSVQTLLNNLVFSDMSQVQIYNGANEVVYGENAKAFYTANIDNGTELAVGTGWYIRYEKLTGGEETIYLSVLGDLTGDGKVNSADVNRLRQMVNNSEVYTNSNEVVKLSSLIINNGKIPTNADAEIVWNVVCGKIDIADFM